MLCLLPLARAAAQVGTLLDPVESERKGAILAGRIVDSQPTADIDSTGVLTIRDTAHHRTAIPVQLHVASGLTNWVSTYAARITNAASPANVLLTVVHSTGQPVAYRVDTVSPASATTNSVTLSGNGAMIPFAGSDFWLADLGLEFFHWPKQRLLGREVRSSQSCYILESNNPQPATNAYSRVISWLDIQSVQDSGQAAIVHAEAYDARNNLLKEFDPKEFKKIKGQWQLKEMEIVNRQTGSRTRITFDLPTH